MTKRRKAIIPLRALRNHHSGFKDEMPFPKKKKKKPLLICSIFSCPWIISINKNLTISGGLLSSFKKKKSNFEKLYYRSPAKAWFRCQVGKTHTQLISWATGWHCSVIYINSYPLRENIEKHFKVWTCSLCNHMRTDLTTTVQATHFTKLFQFGK